MSVIDTFLQKRKMHESQHGFIMVFVAYVLSALMLLLGSDVFYNINSTAAGMGKETVEEAQNIIRTGMYGIKTIEYAAGLTKADLLNPYGLSDTISDATAGEALNTASLAGDTVWFLGDAMDGATFDTLLQQLDSSVVGKIKGKNDEVVVKSQSVQEAVATTYGNVTSKEIKMLERIVQAEAGGEDMIGKILIVNVIMNRVADKHFPDTIKEVIFQKEDGDYQFSPVSNERYWALNISDETKEAVKKALSGKDYSKGALYFVARKRTNAHSIEWFDDHLDKLFKHGGHEFYKNK